VRKSPPRNRNGLIHAPIPTLDPTENARTARRGRPSMATQGTVSARCATAAPRRRRRRPTRRSSRRERHHTHATLTPRASAISHACVWTMPRPPVAAYRGGKWLELDRHVEDPSSAPRVLRTNNRETKVASPFCSILHTTENAQFSRGSCRVTTRTRPSARPAAPKNADMNATLMGPDLQASAVQTDACALRRGGRQGCTFCTLKTSTTGDLCRQKRLNG
jgi:hypothetical protein